MSNSVPTTTSGRSMNRECAISGLHFDWPWGPMESKVTRTPMPADDPFAHAAPVQGAFPNTCWSVVLLAGAGSSPDARSAFGRLYSTYQPALQAFLRRHGRTEDEAADMVQGFFEYLLGEQRLQLVRREGRFRC